MLPPADGAAPAPAFTADEATAAIDALSFLRAATVGNPVLSNALASQPTVMSALLATAHGLPGAMESLNADLYTPALAAIRDNVTKQLRKKEGAFTGACTLAQPTPLPASAAAVAAAVVVNVAASLLDGPAAAAAPAELLCSWLQPAAASLVAIISTFDVNANVAHLTRAMARLQELQIGRAHV